MASTNPYSLFLLTLLFYYRKFPFYLLYLREALAYVQNCIYASCSSPRFVFFFTSAFPLSILLALRNSGLLVF